MDTLRLPVVRFDAPISEAAAAMRVMQRSGLVVVDKEGGLRVVKAGDLAAAKREGAHTVQAIAGLAVKTIDRHDVSRFNLDIANPHATPQAFEAAADAAGVRYLAAEVVGHAAKFNWSEAPAVLLVTRHEGFAAELAGPADLFCDGPVTHTFAAGAVAPGEDCPYGDGATIVAL